MKSHAVVMRSYGGPEVLVFEERELADESAVRPGEVRLRALASAVNHSDLEIRAGHWPVRRESVFPYVPGLEVVGEVVEVAPDVVDLRVGDRAWTMMQGLGGVRGERDGGYAEHVTVAAANVAPLPASVDPVSFATIGLAGVTAYEGLRRVEVSAEKTIAVTGASGGVGSIGVLLAKAAGAKKVIALTRSSPMPAAKTVDGILDVVGGKPFTTLIAALRPGGRYCLVGAIAGGDVQFDAWSLLDGLILTGYSTEDLNGTTLRAATNALLELNILPDPPLVLPLREAARAHALLESREAKGRVVLVP